MDMLMENPSVMNDPWSPVTQCMESIDSSSQGFDMPEFDPLDSVKYLESLESRLNRIKGKTREPTAKDMLKSLGQMKDGQLKVMIDDSETPYVSTHEPEEMLHQDHPAIAALQRRIQPQKQALTAGELKRLVENDDLEKLAQTLLSEPEATGVQESVAKTGTGAEDSDKDIDESLQDHTNS